MNRPRPAPTIDDSAPPLIGRHTQLIGALTVALALLLAAMLPAWAAPANAVTPVCTDFEDLVVGTKYNTGDTFTSGPHTFHVHDFLPAGGGTTANFVEVEDDQDSGGTGNDLELNNQNLRIDLPQPVAGVRLNFGYYGGDVNLAINGALHKENGVAGLNGLILGGVQITLTPNGANRFVLTAVGTTDSFIIGGQEFFVDNICVLPEPDEQDPPDTPNAPDLGDAPDSTNHHGLNNTAYPGIPGQFPTVWEGAVPSGPKHTNAGREAILGNFLSREAEADRGPDADGIHNILDDGSGAGSADVRNRDRFDDGWRNPDVPIIDCRPTTLRVRVSKANAASLDKMYLNVWSDGNRDGDWQDAGKCEKPGETPSTFRANEWIVRDYVVDLTTIPAGGFVDIPVTTLPVLDRPINDADNRPPMWMRFTLSDSPAARISLTAQADGRGPQHPATYAYGETEDYLWRPVDEGSAGQPGDVTLDKFIVGNPTTVQAGDVFTYSIVMTHTGGTAPAEVIISDTLPSGVTLAGRPSATEVAGHSGGVNVLLGDGSVRWRGAIGPDSTLRFDIPVRAIVCYGGGEKTLTNVVQARVKGGPPLSDSVSVNLPCDTLTVGDITVDFAIGDPPAVESAAAQLDGPIAWIPDVPGYLIITMTNLNSRPANVGLHLGDFEIQLFRPEINDEVTIGAVDCHERPCGPLTATVRGLLLPAVQIAGGESTTTYVPLHGYGTVWGWDLKAAGDIVSVASVDDNEEPFYDGEIDLGFTPTVCLLDEGATICPAPNDDNQDRVRRLPRFLIRWYTQDLGDAPDSTNHFGAPMDAYAGQQANFPTVFDPATGAEQGPRHYHPRPFHLGELVSWEGEADFGPDQDLVNNLEPAANQPNLDRHDDGVRPGGWTLDTCRTTTIPVQIFISPQIVPIFQQADAPGYLNVWFDGNRDGDWADGRECDIDNQKVAALEHIVIDYTIDVVALGAGLHTINVPTGAIPWPDDVEKRPAWVRVTLSERPSNKPLNTFGIDHGDGRGHARPFRFGETEDFLWRPSDQLEGPDVVVRKQGRVFQRFNAEENKTENLIAWTVAYRNAGDVAATNVVLRDQLEDGQDLIAILVGLYMPDGVQRSDEGTALRFNIGDLAPGEGGRIVIITKQIDDVARLTNRARISADEDVNPNNNTARAQVQLALRAPRILFPISGTTSRSTMPVVGLAAPGSDVTLYVNGTEQPTSNVVNMGDYTVWRTSVQLEEGENTLVAVAKKGGLTSGRSNLVELTLESDLTLDPVSISYSLNIAGSNWGNQSPINPINGLATLNGWGVTLGWTGCLTCTAAASAVSPQALVADSYNVSVAVTCEEPNATALLYGLTNEPVALSGPDANGFYSADFIPDVTEPGEYDVTLTVACGDVETSSTGTVIFNDATGHIRDASTGENLSNAQITLFAAAVDNDTGVTALSLWGDPNDAQTNPQTSDADGLFAFSTPPGTYYIEVTRAGYQPYRSNTLLNEGPLGIDVPLTPVIDEDARVRIEITEYGFEPPLATVPPGTVIEWFNADAADHGSQGDEWDSGLLVPGASYKTQVAGTGTYTYVDPANPDNTATIIVASTSSSSLLYIPLLETAE